MSSPPVCSRFLGTWVLVPESCDYEQNDPPLSGTYEIRLLDGTLHFDMRWTDSSGEPHAASFSGVPDGEPKPFAGGELADALAITAVSDRELNSSAFFRGRERMVAQRQLDDTGQAMRVIQLVRLPDGTSLRNISIYRRQTLN